MKPRKTSETTDMIWRCDWLAVRISITLTRQYFQGYDHLEIKSLDPERAPLPITETGYISYFEPAGELDALGGAVVVALMMLDTEALSSHWQQQLNAQRQGSLF